MNLQYYYDHLDQVHLTFPNEPPRNSWYLYGLNEIIQQEYEVLFLVYRLSDYLDSQEERKMYQAILTQMNLFNQLLSFFDLSNATFYGFIL